MAQYERQWIDSMPKVRLLPGEVERDRQPCGERRASG
jgi:hypothetical protein